MPSSQITFSVAGHFQLTPLRLNDPTHGIWLFVLDGSIEVHNLLANKVDALMISDSATVDITAKSCKDLWLMEVSMVW
jgi:hypothetical protein